MNLRMLSLTIFLLLAFVCSIPINTFSDTPSTQEPIAAAIIKLGGQVEFDATLPGKPIVKVDLHSTKVTDADLVILKDLSDLRELDLRLNPQITDDGVTNLAGLTKLKFLNLFRTQLSDKGLAHLQRLTELQTLLIGGTKVTDAGLVQLKPFTKLKKLSLFKTAVSDAGIAPLKVLVNLEHLSISGSQITEQGEKELQQALPKLSFRENVLTSNNK
jgi:internalin A